MTQPSPRHDPVTQPWPSHIPAMTQPWPSHDPAMTQPWPNHIPAMTQWPTHDPDASLLHLQSVSCCPLTGLDLSSQQWTWDLEICWLSFILYILLAVHYTVVYCVLYYNVLYCAVLCSHIYYPHSTLYILHLFIVHKCTGECKSVTGNVCHDKSTFSQPPCRIWMRLTITYSWW